MIVKKRSFFPKGSTSVVRRWMRLADKQFATNARNAWIFSVGKEAGFTVKMCCDLRMKVMIIILINDDDSNDNNQAFV